MTATQRRYQHLQRMLQRFEEALRWVEDGLATRHPRVQDALRRGIESEIDDLQQQLWDLQHSPPAALTG